MRRDLNDILYSDTIPVSAVAEFLERNSPDEEYLVRIIRKYLMDDALRELMHIGGFSIEDVLNGRTEPSQAATCQQVVDGWNRTLGISHFRK